ncbi:hypothetical protein [Burkholderia sp. TSV86]|uniref:hypothetical protein n=1 Tax=Burkholderia sp. TSV86 TaxID=1385594 RepID=UPI0012E3AF28|nr:hypothetical protein [Burkholderia sp. TSV86]
MEERSISPISELSLDLDMPFSDIDPDAQENIIQEIMAECFPRSTRCSISLSPSMTAGETDIYGHDFGDSEELPQINQCAKDATLEEVEDINQASPISNLTQNQNATNAQYKKQSSILVNPASIATIKILRLASESVGTGPGKIERQHFEVKHGLSPGSLQNFINADGTLTRFANHLAYPSPQQKITPEIIRQAKSILKNSNKKISEIAHGFGFRPSHFYNLLKKSILSPTSTQIPSIHKKNHTPQPLTPDFLKLAVQSIGIAPEKINQIDFCSIHNIPLGILKKYITVEGTLTCAGQAKLEESMSNETEKQRAIKEASLRLAKPGQWNFPYADLLFAHSFKTFSQIWEIRFDVKTPEYSHSIGSPYSPYAGALILEKDHYSVQVDGHHYDTPPDGDCAFHALNILDIYNKGKQLNQYIINPQRPDGISPLSIPADDTIIKNAIREIRHIACGYAIRNIDEIALAIPDQPTQEASDPSLPIAPLSPPVNVATIQVARPSESSALPACPHYSPISDDNEYPPEFYPSSSYLGYLTILDDWSCPPELSSLSASSISVEKINPLESGASSADSHDLPVVVEESRPSSSGKAPLSFQQLGTGFNQRTPAEDGAQHGISGAATHQTPGKAISIRKKQNKTPKNRTINAKVLNLARSTIAGNSKNIPLFAKEHGFTENALRAYISNDGLTLAGEQMLAKENNKNALNPITFELVKLASKNINDNGMSRDDFARSYRISSQLLKNYLKADGTLTRRGEHVFRNQKSLFHKRVPLTPIADRLIAVKEAALQLMKFGEWNFPHADLLFAHSFKMFALDHNMQFDIRTPEYSQRIGKPSAPYIGALILQQNHYGVQIGDRCYDVPADGDCAFHALNILRLHNEGRNFGDYILGPQRPDGVIPLNVPPNNTTIKLAIGGLRYVVAEHAMRHTNEIANAMVQSE